MGRIDTETLDARMQMFYPSLCIQSNTFSFPSWLQGVAAHYHVLSDAQYAELTK
jgi:hypothetical protein